MDKKSKDIIKEVIEDILKIKKEQAFNDLNSQHSFDYQKTEGGRIVYVVEEIEKWFENQYK
jgi:hypothetical protein